MQRKQVAIRFFTYGVMAIATVVGVIVCIGWAMGYRFDLMSGQLSQVALLQFNTFPTGAVVDINGASLSTRTPTRSNIKTGQTKVSMSLTGYRGWSKTVSALPSSVRWLDYARLVPQNVKTESVKTFTNVVDMLPTPDRKWAAVLTSESTGDTTLVDLADPKQIRFSAIELSNLHLATDGESKFKIIEWDKDSRYLLVKHQLDDQVEYLEYDRQDKITRNLSSDFGLELTELHFSNAGGDVIYTLTGADLRKINYADKSISAPLATSVTSYVLLGDSGRIVYLSKKVGGGKTSQVISIYDDGKITKLKTYDDAQTTLIGFFRNNDIDYLAVGRGEMVSVYPDPLKRQRQSHDFNKSVAYLSSPGGIDWMKVNPTGRFVLAGKGNKVVCYDVETTENYSFELARRGEPVWLDGYHLLDVKNGVLNMVEFDGQNAQHLVSGRLPAFLSANEKYLLSLDSISGGAVLQRSQMVID